MGVGNLAGITAELMRHGRSSATPVAIVRWGTKSTQRTITGTLATIVETAESTSLLPPAIIIVGEVVALRDRLHWFENRPLSGKRIINTRSRAQASQLSVLLTDLGAEVLELPTIAVEPAGRESALAAEIENLEGYQWIVFTSANGVHAFFNLLLAIKGDIRGLGSARLASIGPGTTAAINGYRIRVDCTASEAVAEGLLAALDAYTWEGVRVLLPRAARARDLLPDALRARGAAVTVAAAYTTVTPESVDESIKDAILHDRYDLITFSSPSTFENFAGLFGASGFAEIARTLRAISIGPVTTAAMALSGVTPVAQAREHTIPGIAATIREYLQK
jgi:uroporphyrinogen III methyltransferase/synthase